MQSFSRKKRKKKKNTGEVAVYELYFSLSSKKTMWKEKAATDASQEHCFLKK